MLLNTVSCSLRRQNSRFFTLKLKLWLSPRFTELVLNSKSTRYSQCIASYYHKLSYFHDKKSKDIVTVEIFLDFEYYDYRETSNIYIYIVSRDRAIRTKLSTYFYILGSFKFHWGHWRERKLFSRQSPSILQRKMICNLSRA